MIELEGPIDLIDCDEELEVFRDGNVVYKDGKPVKINKSDLCIICNVQPLGGKDLMMVPEGDRYKEQYILYTKGEPLKANDRVVRLCKNYQVQTLESWGSYQKARIMAVDVGVYSND
jgi:hypothetical protein